MATSPRFRWFTLAQMGTCQLLAQIFRALIGASTSVSFKAFTITGGAFAPLAAAPVDPANDPNAVDEVVLFNNSTFTIQIKLDGTGDYIELPAKASMTVDCINSLSEVYVRLDAAEGTSYTLRAILRSR